MQVPETDDLELQILYAIILGWPVDNTSFSITSLSGDMFAVEKLAGVSLLGPKIINLYSYYGRYWKDTRVEKNIEGWGDSYDFDTPAAWEFYDLKKDSHEMKNEYANQDYIEIIEDLKKQLIQKRKELNEEDKDFPHIQAIIDSHWDK